VALKPLNCTRCGAPLQDPPQNELIRCGICGQNHHFDPDSEPPPAPPPVQVQMPTYARRMWLVPIAVSLIGLLSTVVFLFAGKEPAPGGGASKSSGAITPSSDGPGDPSATYRDGEAVDVWWGSQWWKGTIKRVNGGGTYHIGYDGWASSWDEDVTARRLRRRGAP
jgi:hypothetical protein